MISLRKHIDSYKASLKDPALDAFRSSLLAMAECGQRAMPALGDHLNRRLSQIAGQVDGSGIHQTANEVRTELSVWADRALEHHKDNEREIREIISTVAKTAESLGESGDRYTREIGQLTGKLRALADMKDIGVIRRSILESTHALRTCVEQMAEDNRASMARLTGEVVEYRTKLEESERVSRVDPLTGLANRRAFEKKLKALTGLPEPFTLLMLDLNNFKPVNDTFGHLAGDDLLKQFADELKRQFTASDLVARWGGDEFAIVMQGAVASARERVERVRRWVFGEYRLTATQPAVKVSMSAAMGLVEWRPGESESDLLARADREVYRSKSALTAAKQAVPPAPIRPLGRTSTTPAAKYP